MVVTKSAATIHVAIYVTILLIAVSNNFCKCTLLTFQAAELNKTKC